MNEVDSYLAFGVIVLSLLFTFTNGLQDGSSVTAGLIFCRALSPLKAVFFVAFCELMGALWGGSAVANSVIAVTNLNEKSLLLTVLFCALVSAIIWNFFSKIFNYPSSSTHALFGGLLGALLAAGLGDKYIIWGEFRFLHPTGFAKIVISLFSSPLLGFIAGYVLLCVVMLLLRRAKNSINSVLQYGQVVSVGLLAFGHGANDPQKSMGVILLALQASGYCVQNEIPLWVRLVTGISIVLGVLSLAPGIVKKVGTGIFKLKIVHGFAAESAASFIVLFSSVIGFPVSTSQVISTSIMGVGSSERFKDVRWFVARDIFVSWFLTIPCTAFCAYSFYFFVNRFFQFVR